MRSQVFDTGTIKNLGAVATRDLEAGEFIAEYCGEIISNKEMKQRCVCMHMLSHTRSNCPLIGLSPFSIVLSGLCFINSGLAKTSEYLFNIGGGLTIDASRFGNVTR